MRTSSRILLHVSRLIGVVPAANRVRYGCRARAVGLGLGAGARCDVDRWLPAARARARGEGRLVLTSSRILLCLSRLIGAVLTANLVRHGCQGARAVGLGRWSAPRRRSLGSARRRVLASGEGRLVLTSPRILLCLSRLTGAVLTANRVGRGCRAWAVGHRALVDEFEADGTSRHAREGGEGVCARGAVGWTALPTKSGVRYFPSIQKLASKARRPNRVATAPTRHRPRGAGRPPPPRTPRARRTALVRPSVVALIPGSPAPVVQAVHWVTA